MEQRNIVSTDKYEINYHGCLKNVITLSGVMESEITIRFTSESSKVTSYEFEYINSAREIKYSDSKTYAKGIGLDQTIMKHIDEVFENLEIELSKDDRQVILKAIVTALEKTESRFGHSVQNYNEFNADAIIIIKAVDNGKPKHKVTFFNHNDWEENIPEDYSVGTLNGRSIFVKEEDKNYVVWLIEKDSISLQDLLVHLMCEFENPYLIIEPTQDFNIILDFRLKTDLYNVAM